MVGSIMDWIESGYKPKPKAYVDLLLVFLWFVELSVLLLFVRITSLALL